MELNSGVALKKIAKKFFPRVNKSHPNTHTPHIGAHFLSPVCTILKYLLRIQWQTIFQNTFNDLFIIFNGPLHLLWFFHLKHTIGFPITENLPENQLVFLGDMKISIPGRVCRVKGMGWWSGQYRWYYYRCTNRRPTVGTIYINRSSGCRL